MNSEQLKLETIFKLFLKQNKELITFIKKFSIILFFVILFACIDGYVQWIFGTNLLGFKSPSIRVTGIFNTEEVLGHFLSHLSPLLLALLSYVYGISKKNRI